MGQVLHGRATTTETVRRAIQNSQASIRTLAKQSGNAYTLTLVLLEDKGEATCIVTTLGKVESLR